MKNLFQRRSSQSLTLLQIQRLAGQSQFSPVEIETWYERFIRSYASGYVSLEEFHEYIKQLSIYHGNQGNQVGKSLARDLFANLDLNADGRLNFEEYFRFTLLVNQDSAEEKLRFILNIYDPRREIRFTREEMVVILTDMFYILNLPKSTNQLSEKLDYIFKSINLTDRISWNTFSVSLLNHSILFELLLSTHFVPEIFEEYFTMQF